MGNLADDYGTDVEIYRKALSTTVHADTPTGAPAQLLDLLDLLGLQRKQVRTAGPVYTWHEVPEHLDPDEQKRLATRAIPVLLIAGYDVNCSPEVFDETAYHQALRDLRTSNTRPIAPSSTPTAAASNVSARRAL